MKEEGAFLRGTDILAALDSYFMYCSIELTVQTLSVVAVSSICLSSLLSALFSHLDFCTTPFLANFVNARVRLRTEELVPLLEFVCSITRSFEIAYL